jgi:hypothetical protein
MSPREPVPEALVDFCILLSENGQLVRRVQSARSPREIVAIAAAVGCEISTLELQAWSDRLTAPCFPWFQRDEDWLHQFFA